MDTTNLFIKNGFNEYSFSFQPKQMSDHQILCEHLEDAKRQVEMIKPPWSTKEVRLHHLNMKKEFLCSQLFAPKVNLEVQHTSELYSRPASITLFLRDAIYGTIYINAS